MDHPAPRILIVEDDQRLAELTAEYLQANGFEVSVEGDGARAARRIVDSQPDLVILDLMLPGEDGLSICRRVRSQYPGPILMLTARSDELDQVRGLDLGPTTTSANPYAHACCWRASRPCCAAAKHRTASARTWPSARCASTIACARRVWVNN